MVGAQACPCGHCVVPPWAAQGHWQGTEGQTRLLRILLLAVAPANPALAHIHVLSWILLSPSRTLLLFGGDGAYNLPTAPRTLMPRMSRHISANLHAVAPQWLVSARMLGVYDLFQLPSLIKIRATSRQAWWTGRHARVRHSSVVTYRLSARTKKAKNYLHQKITSVVP